MDGNITKSLRTLSWYKVFTVTLYYIILLLEFKKKQEKQFYKIFMESVTLFRSCLLLPWNYVYIWSHQSAFYKKWKNCSKETDDDETDVTPWVMRGIMQSPPCIRVGIKQRCEQEDRTLQELKRNFIMNSICFMSVL